MKRKLFLADLNYVNRGREWTILPFPLNVAFIAALILKMLPDAFAVKIFKDPNKFLEAITHEKPDVVAFSNYIWNKNLSLQFARHLKYLYPSCITVMGGPNYNFAELEWVEDFARKNRQIDFHIEGEGEVKFYNLMACCITYDFDMAKVKEASPAGVTYIDSKTDRFVANVQLNTAKSWSHIDTLDIDLAQGRLRNLDDIPSPYLMGLLDEFLADSDYCPIIETNRGCPYSCTFCNWGAMGKSKSAMFSIDRVEAELRFIAKRNVSKTPYLYIGDANFGLFQRDVEIAHLLRELKDTCGFPQSVYLYFAKNSSEKVIKIAETLKDMTPISLSRQSQNDEVLGNIKRSNISIDTFNSLAALARSQGVNSFVELIFGLPGETKESFYAGVREIARQNVDGLHIFPAMLLNGSEMSTNASRTHFSLKGEWRLIDGCAGKYGPMSAMEFEEIVTETKVLTRDDYFELRLFHFLQALFLDTKIYKDVQVLLGDLTTIDLIMDLIKNYRQATEPFRELIREFIEQAHGEFYLDAPTVFTPEAIDSAINRSVKLNPLYIAKLLHQSGVRDSFHQFLAKRILVVGNTTEDEIAGVLNYINASIYPFDGSMMRELTMYFDAVGFAKRSLVTKPNVSEYLSTTPRTFLYLKPITYNEYIDNRYADRPLSQRIYEVLLHHTKVNFRQTLINQLIGEITATEDKGSLLKAHKVEMRDNRVIRLEGGWLY